LISSKNILKFLSSVGIVVYALLILPALLGLFYGENVKAYLLIMISLLLINIIIFFLLRKHTLSLSIQDSILSVNLVWLLLGLAGAIPFVIQVHTSFSSAFFESISGFTTTGATVFSDVESLPKSILLHRSITHWIGGMGIIVLGVGLLPLLNPNGSLSLFKAESTGISIDKISPKIKDTAKKLWFIYLLFTLSCALLYKLFGMNWFDAFNHSFSTISTGGFSTKNTSLGFYHSNLILITCTIFMFLSSINFISHIKFFYGDRSSYNTEEIRWLIFIVTLLSFCLALVHYFNSNDTFYHALLHSSFTITSIATTTGFATLDYAQWGNLAIMIMLFAMVSGGNSGSTAGGIKTIRHIIFFKNIALEIKKAISPDTISSIFLNKKEIKNSTISSVFGFLSLYLMTVFVTMAYLYARGFDEMSSLSTALATVGNIGPGFALTGPSQNYGFFSSYDKIFLSISMIIGRLECYTVFIVFSSGFWKKF
jgi:trk system potassium uptake protein